jgi:hypothetical protein
MLPAALLSRYRFDLFAGAFRASQTEAARQHADQSEQYARGPQIRANSARNFYVIPREVEAATQAAAGGEARLSIPVHYLKAALRDPSTPLRSAQDDV